MKKKASTSRRPIRRKPSRKPVRFEVRGEPSKVNMIYEFKTSKAALAALSPDARAVLLLGGHIVNEINTLMREFIFNLKAHDDSVMNAYAGIHHFTLLRLLIGKVTEGLDVVQRRVFKRSFAREYIPLVEKTRAGKRIVAKVKSKMNDQGLLRKLRNEHVFHNPDDKLLLAAFDTMPEEEDWRMLCATSRQSVRFPMSHIVASKALLDATGKTGIVEAIETIRDEVLETSDALAALFEQIVVALADHGKLFKPPQELKDISEAPDAFAVVVPPIVRDTTNELT